MIKYFVSSDIHSFYDEWIRALMDSGFELNNSDHHIIVLGDLFDRGTQSLECYEFVKSLMEQDRCIYIRGNHEDLLFDACKQLGRVNISSHHISNGTIKSIGHFLGINEYDVLCNVYRASDFENKVEPILEFIRDNTRDYYELGNFIFVHGWVPTTEDSNGNLIVHENWRDGDWRDARWICGMKAAHDGQIIPGKIIICGHWHTSFGHSKYHNDGSEWNPEDCNLYPYVDTGIIAIDACTAYSKMVNVITIEKEENGMWAATIPEAEDIE